MLSDSHWKLEKLGYAFISLWAIGAPTMVQEIYAIKNKELSLQIDTHPSVKKVLLNLPPIFKRLLLFLTSLHQRVPSYQRLATTAFLVLAFKIVSYSCPSPAGLDFASICLWAIAIPTMVQRACIIRNEDLDPWIKSLLLTSVQERFFLDCWPIFKRLLLFVTLPRSYCRMEIPHQRLELVKIKDNWGLLSIYNPAGIGTFSGETLEFLGLVHSKDTPPDRLYFNKIGEEGNHKKYVKITKLGYEKLMAQPHTENLVPTLIHAMIVRLLCGDEDINGGNFVILYDPVLGYIVGNIDTDNAGFIQSSGVFLADKKERERRC
jgi:hypothetical protein